MLNLLLSFLPALFGLLVLFIFILIVSYVLFPNLVEYWGKRDDGIYNPKKKMQYERLEISKQMKPVIEFKEERGSFNINFGEERDLNFNLFGVMANYPIFQNLGSTSISEGKDDFGKFKKYTSVWNHERGKFTLKLKNYENFIILEALNHNEIQETNVSAVENANFFFNFTNNSYNRKTFAYRSDYQFAPPTDRIKSTNGPILFYDQDLNTFIVSPLNNFLISMMNYDDTAILKCGITGQIATIPENFSMKYVIYFGKGVNNTFNDWGDILLQYYKKERKSAYADPILSYLGYWTDNGAYYYYRTEKGLSYEDTFYKIDEYAKKIGLPLKYYQLDSWWYKKGVRKSWYPRLLKLFFGGNLAWEPLEENFPSGLEEFSKKLGKPLVAHNRWFDEKNSDVSNFDHILEDGWSFPISIDFWNEIMERSMKFGFVTYEQDWLISQYDHFSLMREDTDFAYEWLKDMHTAATNHGLTIQYCMPTPSFFLQSIEFDNVTQVRCGDDYNARFTKNYYIPNFTQTCLLSNAVSLWPFFDCFFSSNKGQGNFGLYREKYPELCTLVSNLSAGLVGPADKYDLLNKELLMKTCRSDGLLLKPDRAATPIDLMFKDHSKYYIASTESTINSFTWYYVYLVNFYPKRVLDKTLRLSDLDLTENYLLYDFDEEKAKILDENTIEEISLKKNQHKYLILAPLIENKYALIGIKDKFVSCPNKVFTNINLSTEELNCEINYIKGEEINIIVYSTGKPKNCELNNKSVRSEFDQDENLITISLKIESEKSQFKIKWT